MEWDADTHMHVMFANGNSIIIPEGMWEFTAYGLVTSYSDVTKKPIVKMYPWGQIQEVMQFVPTDD